jgi:hypothetical protein
VSLTNENIYQYVEPKGQSVTRTVMMLKDSSNVGNEEKAADYLIKSLDVSSVDVTPVFFDLDKVGLKNDVPRDLLEVSMIGFFGFRSLNAVVEDLRDNLHRIQVANDKKKNTIFTNSVGFSSIKEDAKNLDSRFGTNVIDQKSVMDLF